MRFLALTPLLTLMLAPAGLGAHPHEGAMPDERFTDMLRQEVQALQERVKGARLGISLGNWADGPVNGLSVLSVSPGGPAEQAGLRAGEPVDLDRWRVSGQRKWRTGVRKNSGEYSPRRSRAAR